MPGDPPTLVGDPTYDHGAPTQFSKTECESVVGRKAILTLTGRIVEAREGPAGPFVMFEPDERFGFGEFRFGIDLEPITVLAEGGVDA